MSLKKLAPLNAQNLDDLMPLLSLPVCRRVRLVANLSAQACVFESFLHSVLSNFQREYTMGEVFVTGFFMESL